MKTLIIRLPTASLESEIDQARKWLAGTSSASATACDFEEQVVPFLVTLQERADQSTNSGTHLHITRKFTIDDVEVLVELIHPRTISPLTRITTLIKHVLSRGKTAV